VDSTKEGNDTSSTVFEARSTNGSAMKPSIESKIQNSKISDKSIPTKSRGKENKLLPPTGLRIDTNLSHASDSRSQSSGGSTGNSTPFMTLSNIAGGAKVFPPRNSLILTAYGSNPTYDIQSERGDSPSTQSECPTPFSVSANSPFPTYFNANSATFSQTDHISHRLDNLAIEQNEIMSSSLSNNSSSSAAEPKPAGCAFPSSWSRQEKDKESDDGIQILIHNIYIDQIAVYLIIK
jgi:hypothetical protein